MAETGLIGCFARLRERGRRFASGDCSCGSGAAAPGLELSLPGALGFATVPGRLLGAAGGQLYSHLILPVYTCLDLRMPSRSA